MSMFGWYFLLFAPQLVIGAAIGWWIGHRRGDVPRFETFLSSPRPPSPPPPLSQNELREQEILTSMGLLKQLASSIKDDVREHASKVNVSHKKLTHLAAQEGTVDPVAALAAITPIVEANEDLQQRLLATERKLAEQTEQLDKQTAEARTDPLTGLLNRRGMEDGLTKLFEAHDQTAQSFCLMLLDIDHFKQFNDRYGHDVGDVVLRDVARVVSGAVRTHDIVARFGGEEFVVLLNKSALAEAKEVVEHVRAAVESNAVREADGDLKVTISLGLAQIDAEEDAAALLKRADVAMYAAKDAG